MDCTGHSFDEFAPPKAAQEAVKKPADKVKKKRDGVPEQPDVSAGGKQPSPGKAAKAPKNNADGAGAEEEGAEKRDWNAGAGPRPGMCVCMCVCVCVCVCMCVCCLQ
jgi:hypothetical protein